MQSKPKSDLTNHELIFNDDTGEKESSQTLWGSGKWTKLEKSRGKTLERANSFVGSRSRSATATAESLTVDGKPKAIAVVDPFSTVIKYMMCHE